MFRCRRCMAFGSKEDFTGFTQEQLKDHVEIHQHQSLMSFGDEIRFEDCFPSVAAKKPAAPAESADTQQVTSFESAKPLLVNIIKTNREDGRIKCNECQSSLKCQIPPNATWAPYTLLNHPMVHFHQLLFACKLCDVKTKTLMTIRIHGRKKHKQKLYKSISGGHWSRLVEVARKCYGSGRDKAIKTPKGRQRPCENGRMAATAKMDKSNGDSSTTGHNNETPPQMQGSIRKRYSCSICNFSTSFYTLLERHISVIHQGVSSAANKSE